MSRTRSKKSLYIGLAALALGVVGLWIFRPTQSKPQACGEPPGPFFGQSGNIELSLAKTLAVFKGTAKPEVVDVIPPEARSLQMVGFLSCMAAERGLIKSNAELLEYTRMLTSLSESKPIMVRHVGLLGTLARYLQADESEQFTVSLLDPSGKLNRFWVDETRAVDWTSWAKKFCSSYPCLRCVSETEGGKLRLSISLIGSVVKTSNSEASDVYVCGEGDGN